MSLFFGECLCYLDKPSEISKGEVSFLKLILILKNYHMCIYITLLLLNH